MISQNRHPIAFYSRKLSSAQTLYTTIEQELLAIVETLKEFRNILLGQEIHIYTDHQNLTRVKFNTDRVMRWRLVIEEYGPIFHHIPGIKNVVADALSRLPKENDIEDKELIFNELIMTNAETSAIEEEDDDLLPVIFRLIQKYQQNDKDFQSMIRNHSKQYIFHSFRGGGKEYKLICTKDTKIVILKELQKRIVQWYHTYLSHPGINRTELTIHQHFTWKDLRTTVFDICGKCPTCQRTKRSPKMYGK